VVAAAILAGVLANGVAVRWQRRTGAARRRCADFEWAEPSAAERCGPLMARALGERGRPVILLHGLAASGRLWGATYDRLTERHRLLVPDLIGFGASGGPFSAYTLVAHAGAVAGGIAAARMDDVPAVVAGHSFGALVALALARYHPRLVGALLLISPPLYRDRVHARAATQAALAPLERIFATDSWSARLLCRQMCSRRPRLARRVASAYRPELPVPIAWDGVRHSWESYSEGFAEMAAGTARPSWLSEAGVPVRLLTGAEDRLPDVELLRELAATVERVRLDLVGEADHLLPLMRPDLCVSIIEELSADLDDRRVRAGDPRRTAEEHPR
jgi:pimeloyl-ACP methyl ester carboxylesterase